MHVGTLLPIRALIRATSFLPLFWALFFGSLGMQKSRKIEAEPARRPIWLAEGILEASGSTLGLIRALGRPFWEALGSPGQALGGILEATKLEARFVTKKKGSNEKASAGCAITVKGL